MSRIPSIGCERQILFWTALVSFAVAAGYVCENRLIQNRISSLSLDQGILDMLLEHVEDSLHRLRAANAITGEGKLQR